MKTAKATVGNVRGSARIRKSTQKDRVEVFFDERKQGMKDMYAFTLSQCPDYIRGGKYYVEMSNDADEIISTTPVEGSYEIRFVEFGHKKDEAPAPFLKAARSGIPGKNGQSWTDPEHYEFTARCEIVSEENRGMPFTFFFRYLFEDDGDGGVLLRGSGKAYDRLVEFLQSATGDIGSLTMKFTDNLLPALQKKLLAEYKNNKRTFRVTLDGKGFPVTFSEVFKADEADDDGEESDLPWTDELEDDDKAEKKAVPAPMSDDDED